MNYSVTLYNKTGFNAVNIPYSATVLAAAAASTLTPDVVDLVQNYVIDHIDIAATFDQVKNADYAKVGDWYYMIDGVQMLSDDVARLHLIPDYILSAGISNLMFTDGYVVRRTVDPADDGFGDYTEPDPYLGCNEPLVLETSDMIFNDTNDEEYTVVTSTIDLEMLGELPKETLDASKWAYTGTNKKDSDYVITPNTQAFAIDKTDFTIYKLSVLDKTVISPGTAAFDGSSNTIQKGIRTARDLGLDGSVLSQVSIPESYVSVINVSDRYSKLTGKGIVTASGLNKKYNAEIRHNRLLVGDICKYGLISASGEKVEFAPEDIMTKEDTQPNVRCIADPRPDGKPYFRYEKYLKNITIESFFMNSISGLTWREAPLVYTGASGSAIMRQNAATRLAMLQTNNQAANDAAIVNAAGSFANFLGGTAESAKSDGGNKVMPGKSILSLGSYGLGLLGQYVSISNANTVYGLAAQQERFNYNVQTNLVTPEINFPYSANAVRDFMGNGVIAYRYHPSYQDVNRLDTILSQYGYKMTKKLGNEDFSIGQYYTYIQANGASVGGKLPKWWNDGIAAQLSAGVRVWKTKPNTDYYEQQL